jgi:RNA polymerase sigma factor (sigma-70 family)
MLAFANGDATAFETVFERHRSWLLRTLRGQVRSSGLSGDELAEDIAQETWLTVVKTSHDYEPSAKFTTWLYRIAQQRLVDQLRKLGVSARVFHGDYDVSDDDSLPLADLNADPANIIQNRRMLIQFSEALNQLPDEQSEIFILVTEGDMSVPEVAQCLALPLETVKSRLRYARAKLVHVIEELRA